MVKAILTPGQKAQLQALNSKHAQADVDTIISTIQQYVDENSYRMQGGEINVLPIQAAPNKKNKTLELTLLFVNLSQETIYQLRGAFEASLVEEKMTLEAADFVYDHDFLGNWENGQAILVTESLAYQGRPSKRVYQDKDIALQLGAFKMVTDA